MTQQWMQPPARFISGVTSQARKTLFGGLTFLPPMDWNVYFTDFNTYTSGDWSETKTNSGTIALQALNGGSLLVTTGATATNDCGAILNPASFSITPGYRAAFGISFSLSDAVSSNSPSFILGLTKGGPAAPTDGVYFTKASGANKTVSAVLRASSTSTTITNVTGVLANSTQYTLGWFYNGAPDPTISFFASDQLTAASAFSSPNPIGGIEVAAASSSAANPITNLPASTAVLQPEFYIVAPGTTTPTIAIDWIFAAAALSRP